MFCGWREKGVLCLERERCSVGGERKVVCGWRADRRVKWCVLRVVGRAKWSVCREQCGVSVGVCWRQRRDGVCEGGCGGDCDASRSHTAVTLKRSIDSRARDSCIYTAYYIWSVIQPILQSHSNWSLFNETWQKRRRERDNRLCVEIGGMTVQNAIGGTQRTTTHCNTLQHTATHCNTLQHTATHCNTQQHTATHCNTLQFTAIHTATHCNTLQCTVTRCNTYQRAPAIVKGNPSLLTDFAPVTQMHLSGHCYRSVHIVCPHTRIKHTATHCNTLQHTVTLHCSKNMHIVCPHT